MHELAICQALITQVEDIAVQRTAWVRQVRVGVGPLSGIEPQLLESAYPLACAGTRAEGSQLKIEHIDVRVRCRGCGAETMASPKSPRVRRRAAIGTPICLPAMSSCY